MGEMVVYGGIQYVKSACMYAPLFCLYSGRITQTARRRIRIPYGAYCSIAYKPTPKAVPDP